MEFGANFIVRGRKSSIIATSQRPRTPSMMRPPSPVGESQVGKDKTHAAAYGVIMNELGNTRSRIDKVTMLATWTGIDDGELLHMTMCNLRRGRLSKHYKT